jgi:hypothetical protein
VVPRADRGPEPLEPPQLRRRIFREGIHPGSPTVGAALAAELGFRVRPDPTSSTQGRSRNSGWRHSHATARISMPVERVEGRPATVPLQ